MQLVIKTYLNLLFQFKLRHVLFLLESALTCTWLHEYIWLCFDRTCWVLVVVDRVPCRSSHAAYHNNPAGLQLREICPRIGKL